MRYFVPVALILLFAACKKDKNKPKEYTRSFAPVVYVLGPNTAMAGTPLDLKVYFQVSNGCGELDALEVEKKDADTTVVRVRARYETNRACTDNLPVLSTIYTFMPQKAGEHYIRFKGRSGEDVVDTIVVK
jgi:hypothetical protein